MGFLSKLLGFIPASERNGIHLEDADPWRLGPVTDPILFLHALTRLNLGEAILYLEGTADSSIENVLKCSCITPNVRVMLGTIWQCPKVWHLPLNEQTISSLIQVLEKNRVLYFCTHIHAYRDSIVLLEWHDAFGSDPILVSKQIEYEQVKEFASALGTELLLKDNVG
jgi:hypothetical protein